MSKDYETSKGNIFEDLGCENPDALLQRAELLDQVSASVKGSNLSRDKIAEKIGISSDRVDEMVSGHISSFTKEELDRYLSGLRTLPKGQS